MKKSFAALVTLLSVSSAFAGVVMPKGDATAGQAMAGQCAACHGADGNSGSGMFPKLAGQNANYIVKQLKDIQAGANDPNKTGARSVPAMMMLVKDLQEQDMKDIAAYFSSQTIQMGQANKELVELGQKVYRAGDQSKGLAACSACHSPTGKGNPAAGFPALGGQHAEYVEKQLKAFRAAGREDMNAETRTNDTNKMMESIAAKLSDKEIAAVASYVSGLH